MSVKGEEKEGTPPVNHNDPIVFIVWEDIKAWTDSWTSKKVALKKAATKPAICTTVGWLIENGDEFVTITESKMGRDVGFFQRIPWGVIRDIKILDFIPDDKRHVSRRRRNRTVPKPR